MLRDLPKDKTVAVGVIDVRTLEVEQPEQVAERVRKVLAFIEPERVTLTTDCGMKQLPRPCAVQKLKALARGAHRPARAGRGDLTDPPAGIQSRRRRQRSPPRCRSASGHRRS